MKTIALTIFDETLRDGEQQVGIFFDAQTKHELAQLIVKTGVHYLALMPAIHQTEAKLAKRLINLGMQRTLVASTMMEKKYIDRSKDCGVETIPSLHQSLLALRYRGCSHSRRHKTLATQSN